MSSKTHLLPCQNRSRLQISSQLFFCYCSSQRSYVKNGSEQKGPGLIIPLYSREHSKALRNQESSDCSYFSFLFNLSSWLFIKLWCRVLMGATGWAGHIRQHLLATSRLCHISSCEALTAGFICCFKYSGFCFMSLFTENISVNWLKEWKMSGGLSSSWKSSILR